MRPGASRLRTGIRDGARGERGEYDHQHHDEHHDEYHDHDHQYEHDRRADHDHRMSTDIPMNNPLPEEQEDAARAELIARLELMLTDARNGKLVGLACVTVNDDQDYEPWWVTTEVCVHAGAVLRAAAAWLITRMDASALHTAMEYERETSRRLS